MSPLVSARPGVPQTVRPYQYSQPMQPEKQLRLEMTPERPQPQKILLEKTPERPVIVDLYRASSPRKVSPRTKSPKEKNARDRYLWKYEEYLADKMEASIRKDLQEIENHKQEKERLQVANQKKLDDLDRQHEQEVNVLFHMHGEATKKEKLLSQAVREREEVINLWRQQRGMPNLDLDASESTAIETPPCPHKDLTARLAQVLQLIRKTEAELKEEERSGSGGLVGISCSEAEKVLEVESLGAEHAARVLDCVDLTGGGGHPW